MYKNRKSIDKQQKEMKIIGQYTKEEFAIKYDKAKIKEISLSTGIATMKTGKKTINYYREEQDGSWTNYDCKTEE